LVITGIESLSVRAVQFFIIEFDLILFESKFGCDTC
jgi:hypothetical protein